ncbi:MAG: hypothetical protein CNF02_13140 [OM182 bacterium MED-G28]|uniref:Peptidase M60 domain-containing protein n=1 Tax=OM182 bacterium MED-G28 TaxID=1986256 RepID=A0A2A5W6A5_9GAMM|nr:MAG: hypothetical protein CNF02_13140 [OM182 bacterium MED-G28]
MPILYPFNSMSSGRYKCASFIPIFWLFLVFNTKSLADGITYDFSGGLSDSSLASSIASYSAMGSDKFNDSYANYPLTSPQFVSQDGVDFITLAWDSYLRLPSFVEQELKSSNTFQIDIRFRFNEDNPHKYLDPNNPDTWRNILGTNEGSRNALGFNIFVEKVDGDSSLALMVGEGSGREGYLSWIASDISENHWHELSLIFKLQVAKPRIDIIFNGAPTSLYLTESNRVDNALLSAFFSGGSYASTYSAGLSDSPAGLFIGGFPYGDPINQGISLSIDKIGIQIIKGEQDSYRLNQILDLITADVESDVSVSTSLVQEFLQTFSDNWDPIEINAKNFLIQYFKKRGAIFVTEEQLKVQDFFPSKKLAYYLQQWVFDNLFTEVNLSKTPDLPLFPDAAIYPGPVSEIAPRITKEILINGNYQTDPGYMLNGQETVLRPTGLYVPPGEIITISSPENQPLTNWKARIGISFIDLESTWTVYNRFPRIGNSFSFQDQEIQIANPFGGGLYIEIPDGSSLGEVSFVVTGAVEMPTYAMNEHAGLNHSVTDFLNAVNNAYVPYFELIGKKFNFTHPNRFGLLYSEPQALLEKMDSFFDAISIMTGRPTIGIRAEWLAGDRMIPVAGTAMAASYPIHGDIDSGDPSLMESVDEKYWSPLQYIKNDYYSAEVTETRVAQRKDAFTLWHEWGHLHNLPTLGCQEAESNVHLLYVILANKVLGVDIDTALRYSGFQDYDRNDAALDTMFSPNWQIDNRLCLDSWDNEVRYQTRSWARLVEIASLYGWDAVGAIHKEFYLRGLANGKAVNYGLSDDDFIKTASEALNINLVPVFEFWGVPASVSVASELSNLPAAYAFKERLANYRNLIPANQDEYTAVINKLKSTTGSEGRWNYFLANYDLAILQTMRAKIDRIQMSIADVDTDNDGIPNNDDPDNDNDGVLDENDAFPLNSLETADSDNDGFGDNEDPDDDNDGVPDIPELAGAATLTGVSTSAQFFGGARAYDDVFGTSDSPPSFKYADPVDLIAEIKVESSHVNTTGNLYVVAKYYDQFYQLVENQGFQIWNGTLGTLKPAVNGKTFSTINRINIFEDVALGPAGMQLSSMLYFYFAYDTLVNPEELYYSSTPVFFDLIPDN